MKMTATCGIQKFRWREKNKTLVKILGGRQHRTTPAGQILGGREPCGVDAYELASRLVSVCSDKSWLLQTDPRDALSHAPIALYTNVDAQCDQLATVAGRNKLATLATVNVPWRHVF